ncbi:P-loop NTPase fold protein [Pedobacter sp. MR22-3]|uniref:P-loop NTPase fold protein n=1 Tax=Pedobacter sp. MR22-3 TaxID=2994552 RepID=UPI0022472009|nr:P-loop NTPase fold protein [Pedobacter sp. MR22-3]MCX2582733.1 P-loop NTPase fold protein [Pedobacter sp. MR22-3]
MKLEQIKLVLGDLFKAHADVFVIPCSTLGTIGSPFRLGLDRELGYRFKDDLGNLELSSVAMRLFKKSVNRDIVLLFAAAVDEQNSSFEAIEKLIVNIFSIVSSLTEAKSIAMPLIGSGAGGLEGVKLYETWMRGLLASDLSAELSIYIKDINLYHRILSAEPSLAVEETVSLERIYLFEPPAQTELSEYLEKGIWINKHLNAIPLVKEIELGARILVKRYQDIEERSGLVVIAIGVVTYNAGNGENLIVDWKLKDLELRLATEHRYDRAVARVGAKNTKTIMGKLEEAIAIYTEVGDLLPGPELPIRATSKIASLRSDSDKGTDHLEMEMDYTSFAKIIAAKDFIPPLSVALFGKWGSGKSFFMNKLNMQIQDYCGLPNYCSGVVQIHFNAWSYMDANLWASMVSRIFEGLQFYIKGQNATDDEKGLIQKQLNQQLVITSDELSKISDEKARVTLEIKKLQAKKSSAKTILTARINSIKRGSFKKAALQLDQSFKVRSRLEDMIKNDEDIQMSMKEIQKVVPQRYLDNPEEAYEKAKSGYAFVSAFLDQKRLVGNLIFLALVLLMIAVMPWLVNKIMGFTDLAILPSIQSAVFLLAVVTPILIRVKKTYGKVATLISAFWKIREDYRDEIAKAKLEADRQEKAIELQILADQAELKSLDQGLIKAKEELSKLNFRNEHAVATEALYSFIEKRCNSGEYQKHLGIVSIIRKDFEVLSNLFVDHNLEEKERSQEAEEKIQAFRKLFDKPLERIVLYIDDLDRCPEERVVEVLEAVNLLMAFPLFVVVVGVDPRWVKKALAIRYHKQFGEGNQQDEVTAADYLEKIFQVPFHLKQANDAAVKNMLAQLIDVGEEVSDASRYAPSIDMTDSGAGLVATGSSAHLDVVAHASTELDLGYGEHDSGGDSERVKDAHLKLSLMERQVIQQMSGILGSNPRAIKRFVNIYKIVRSHEGLEYLKSEEENSFFMVMFLLAVYHGRFKRLSASLDAAIMTAGSGNGTLEKFLDPLQNSIGSLNSDLIRLSEVLKAIPDGEQFLRKALASFIGFNTLIRRFCFTL